MLPIPMAEPPADAALVEIRDLSVHIPTDHGVVKAVDGLDLTIPRGRTLCLVGESGSGKSQTARALLNQVPRPGRIAGGGIRYHGLPTGPVEITALPRDSAAIRAIRGREIALVAQEPMASLSPVHSIGSQVMEAIRLHLPLTRRQARARAIEIMASVGIPRPGERFDAYPFEFSGGMRQRVCIAMALACEPKLLVADEPTTALDVTTQANILDLLADLQARLGMAILFITHDLGVVAEIADEVAVMYLGRVVEQGPVDAVFHRPRHPYTRALLASVPHLTDAGARLATIRGMVPSPHARPSGCGFRDRCDLAVAGLCDSLVPGATMVGEGHAARCHRAQDIVTA
jgi:peptide/nickel transport system ATP-binding protein